MGDDITRPTKATISGRAFLSLQREAKITRRTTAEYLRLYALEGFLLRLAHSPYRNRFILKGGVLLAAYGLRRPTTDIDGAALQTSNGVEEIRQFVTAVASTALPAELDDGLTFDLENITAEAIRDEDKYGGVRIRLVTRLASAREPFHVDVSIGDPIWPKPTEIWMPRLLGQEPIQLRGYSMEMVLAEKTVTVLQRGSANTRWRDFGDIFVITGRLTFKAGEVRQALQAVADHRRVELANLDDAVDGYAEIAQPRWASWRRKLQLTETLPEQFNDTLKSLRDFANPIITDSIADPSTWDPGRRTWSRGRLAERSQGHTPRFVRDFGT
jgi:predicted nucleotidyltransferase component of viral defense system